MRVFVCLALPLAILVMPNQARARADGNPPSVVALSRQATPDPLEKSFFDALRSHLRELEIKLDVAAAPQTSDPLAMADSLAHTEQASRPLFYTWLVQYPPRVIVYLFEPEGPHLGARESTLGSSTAATSEELALILRSAILARRSGGQADLDEVALGPSASSSPTGEPERGAPSKANVQPFAPKHAEAPAPLPSDTIGLRPWPNIGATFGFAYEKTFSHDTFRGGLHTRLWLGADAVRIGLGYLATPVATLHTDDADLSLERRPVDLFASHSFSANLVNLAGEVRFIVDPQRRYTITAESPLAPSAPRTRWVYAAGAFLRGEVSLTPGLAWTLWAGADLTLNARSFEVTRGGRSRETIAELLTFRPVVGTGLVLFAK
jgi:hypothetical protein